MAGKKNQIELEALLKKVSDSISSNYDVDEIILFGSYAKEQATNTSDVDIAVISPELEKNKPFFLNALDMKKKIKLFEPYLQLLAIPTDVYLTEDCIDPNFIREIKKTGKTIYSKVSSTQK